MLLPRRKSVAGGAAADAVDLAEAPPAAAIEMGADATDGDGRRASMPAPTTHALRSEMSALAAQLRDLDARKEARDREDQDGGDDDGGGGGSSDVAAAAAAARTAARRRTAPAVPLGLLARPPGLLVPGPGPAVAAAAEGEEEEGDAVDDEVGAPHGSKPAGQSSGEATATKDMPGKDAGDSGSGSSGGGGDGAAGSGGGARGSGRISPSARRVGGFERSVDRIRRSRKEQEAKKAEEARLEEERVKKLIPAPRQKRRHRGVEGSGTRSLSPTSGSGGGGALTAAAAAAAAAAATAVAAGAADEETGARRGRSARRGGDPSPGERREPRGPRFYVMGSQGLAALRDASLLPAGPLGATHTVLRSLGLEVSPEAAAVAGNTEAARLVTRRSPSPAAAGRRGRRGGGAGGGRHGSPPPLRGSSPARAEVALASAIHAAGWSLTLWQ